MSDTTATVSAPSRLKVIDMARGTTILLVVIGHADLSGNLTFLGDFRMPLFFLISGYLFSSSKYFHDVGLLIRSRFFNLIVPYFLSGMLVTLFWGIINTLKNGQLWKDAWVKPIAALIYGVQPGTSLLNVPLWFLTCLFVAQIVFCLTMKATNSVHPLVKVVVFSLLSLAGCFIGHFVYLPWNIDVALATQIFIYAGFKMKECGALVRLTNSFSVIAFAIILYAAASFFNTTVDMNHRMYGNAIWFFIGGISGSILVIRITQILSKCSVIEKFLTFIGKESLSVLMFHYGIFILLLRSIDIVNPHIDWIIISAVAITGSLLINELLKRTPVFQYKSFEIGKVVSR